jgi:hypothetical protein
VSVAADVAGLTADAPLVMLPVRLETRFHPIGAPTVVRVRIYPDAIFADSHEPALTATERAAGDRYWTAVTAGQAGPAAWAALLAEYPAPRAAWLVRATDPTAPDPPAARDGSWTRAVEARALPDRWFVAGYRFDPALDRLVEVTRAERELAATPLALTLTPDPDDAAGQVPVAGLDVDPAAAWAFDFTRARAAGMAVELPLPADDPLGGFDRVVAVGVAATVPPDEAGAVLGRLLDAHHYTRGIAVVPQGTPTNNVTAAASGYPSPDPGGAVSFAVERGTGGGPSADVADLLATLGLTDADVDPRIGDGRPAGHPRTGERRSAAAMAEALWPATIGYFLEQAMAPVFDAATIAAARRYMVDTVHGRGPAPALRVGGTPYGVLPVSSLDRWAPARPNHALVTAHAARTDRTWPGRVAAVASADRLVVLARDAGGELHRWTGKGWAPLGVSVAGDPAAAADRDGVVHVVARGEGGALVHARLEGGSVSVDVDDTAGLTGDPAVAASGTRVDVVAVGPAGRLAHRQLQPTDGRRALWAELDGDATDPALAARAPGVLDLVARRGDALVHRTLAQVPRTAWSGWSEVGLPAEGPVALVATEPASRQVPGRVVLVAPSAGGLVWLMHEAAWSAPALVEGSAGLDRPAAALLRAGLAVAAATAAGELRQAIGALGPAGPRRWSQWEPLESAAAHAVTLRTGRDVGPDGAVGAGWTDPAPLPGGVPDLAGAVALATADVTGSGRPDLVVAAPRSGGRVGYRTGFELAAEGTATGGWAGVRDVPLPEPADPAAGCAVALLPGAGGRFDLAVAFVGAAPPAAAQYVVGRGLDAVGDVTGGWSVPWQLPFPTGGAFAGAAVAGGRLVVGAVTGGAVEVLVSDPLAPDGSAPGWAPPLRVPWPDPVVAAAVAVRGDDLVVLVADAAGTTRYTVGRSLGAAGWSAPLPGPAAPAAPPGRLLGIGLAIPALGVRPVVGDRIAGTLRTLRDAWLAAARDVPCVGRTGDPDTDLLELLGMDASAREVRIRPVLGGALVDNLAQLYGTAAFGSGSPQAWRQWLAEARRRVDDALRAVGPPAWDAAAGARAWDPRLGRMVAGEDAPRFAHALVAVRAGGADVPLSETDPLAPENYVDWLLAHGGDVADLRAGWRGLVGERPPLLAILLRQALLLEHARVGADLLGLDPVERRERELHGMPVVTAAPGGGTQVAVPPTVWDRFATEVPGTGRTVAETVADLWAAADSPYASYRASLEVLRDLPTAELQRVFAETLDVASHRIDAWVTAMAADRLRELRRLRAGNHLAAFGWVEDLRPAESDRYAATTVDGAPAYVQRDGGGHVHAPSPAHAAAAAVLRNAHLTRSGEDGRRYAVDLSSARVRAARDLLDAVRNGGALGEVLGARVERGLRRRSAAGPPEDSLERFVDTLRDRFPLVAGKLPAPAGAPEAPPAATAGRAVLDGLALRAAWRSGAVDVDDLTGGHPAATALRDALDAEVAALDEALDATADLLTAEGVHQLVRGNPPAAAASLDALARGVRPPDPDIAQTPRGGTAVTHRVLLVLGSAANPWPAAATPRAELEPAVDGWLADLLGEPATVRCRARTTVADVTTTRTVTLADLGLRAVDLLAIARGGTAELDRRIVWEARRVAAVPLGPDDPDPVVAVLHVPAPGRDPATERTFPEVLELARAAGAVLGAGRPLRPADLVQPHEAGATGSAGVRGAEALIRAEAVRGHVTNLVTLLDTALSDLGPAAGPVPQPPPGDAAFTAARAALRRAALLGYPGSFPTGHRARREADRAELAAQVASVRAEAARRLAAAPAAPAASATEQEQADAATALVTALMGADAAFLPTLVPPGATELEQAIAGGPAALGPAPAAVLRAWSQQIGRVRPAMDRWRRLGLYAETAGRPLALGVAQLPYQAGEAWVGRPAATVPPGRLSLVLHRHAAPAAHAAWSGVLLDEWTELVPNAAELTGIAFHYDDPGAEAPQAVLVAVPPDGSATWDLDTVVAVLHETLDLAKVRAVDAELVGGLGQLVPMTLLAANRAGDTIASDLTRMRTGG